MLNMARQPAIILIVVLVVGIASAFVPSHVVTTTTNPTRTNDVTTVRSIPQPWSSSLSSNRRISQSLRLMTKEETELIESASPSSPVVKAENQGGSNGAVASISILSQEEQDEVYKTAIQRTLAWVGASAAFGTGLFFAFGSETSEEFFAGYLLEQSLSVDNLLVFLLLFEYFQIPQQYQNRVLNWGIIGALVMRAIMIGLGAVAISQFHAVLLGFAAILIFSSGKILLGDGDEEEDLSDNQIVQFSKKLLKSTDKLDEDRFFTFENGEKLATPMLLCLVAVEFSDVVFAVDSVPAVFGVTENPLVVFTSNMFAIMGLRSLYTVLSKAAAELKYLEPAVALILGFIGAKLILEYMGITVPTEASLGVVLSLLGVGVGASLLDNDPPDDDL